MNYIQECDTLLQYTHTQDIEVPPPNRIADKVVLLERDTDLWTQYYLVVCHDSGAVERHVLSASTIYEAHCDLENFLTNLSNGLSIETAIELMDAVV